MTQTSADASSLSAKYSDCGAVSIHTELVFPPYVEVSTAMVWSGVVWPCITVLPPLKHVGFRTQSGCHLSYTCLASDETELRKTTGLRCGSDHCRACCGGILRFAEHHGADRRYAARRAHL